MCTADSRTAVELRSPLPSDMIRFRGRRRSVDQNVHVTAVFMLLRPDKSSDGQLRILRIYRAAQNHESFLAHQWPAAANLIKDVLARGGLFDQVIRRIDKNEIDG